MTMAPRKALAKRVSRPSTSTTTTATSSQSIHKPIKQTSRRTTRHTVLLSKLQTSSTARSKAGGISKTTSTKRRRPSKKLTGARTLSTDLLGALPETTVQAGERSEVQVSQSSSVAKRKGAGVARLMSESLGSRRGVQRKREAVGRIERERWGKNWGAMVAGGKENTAIRAGSAGNGISSSKSGLALDAARSEETTQADRWAALRRHIAGSLAGT